MTRRKKLKLFLVGTPVVLVIALLLLELGTRGKTPDAGTSIVPAHDTTRITGPIDAMGRVEFVTYLDEQAAKGVTPETNAVVPIVEALGADHLRSTGLTGSLLVTFCDHLGIAVPSGAGQTLLSYREFVRAQRGSAPSDATASEENTDVDDHLTTPFTAEEHPRLSAWLDAHEAFLKTVSEAVPREHWYTPYIVEDSVHLWNVLLPVAQDMREVARLLSLRAMRFLGQRKTAAALEDLATLHRLARHVGANGVTVIELLIAAALEQFAREADAVVINMNLPADQLRGYFDNLASLPAHRPLSEVVDEAERFSVLAFGYELERFGIGPETAPSSLGAWGCVGAPDQRGVVVRGLTNALADWREVMNTGNEWYDGFVTALREPDAAKRSTEVDRVFDVIDDVGTRSASTSEVLFAWKVAAGIRAKRQLTASVAAIPQAMRAEVRRDSSIAVNLVGIAVAGFRAEYGHYPERLSDLEPEWFEDVPHDPASGGSLIYQRTEAGFLLYGVGENLTDEGGLFDSDITTPITGDDISLRVPLPSESLAPQTTTGEPSE